MLAHPCLFTLFLYYVGRNLVLEVKKYVLTEQTAIMLNDNQMPFEMKLGQFRKVAAAFDRFNLQHFIGTSEILEYGQQYDDEWVRCEGRAVFWKLDLSRASFS